ncbi:MAG: hypothetical protein D6734_04255 [Candidatus Schekmanbacteria bacterium]|nr:MAG: hypothetical protein D6734_04255 [Candidatus Schekmanbacteria bacterium]
MARRVLGIDIDDYSVKFVQVEKPVKGNAKIRAIEKVIALSDNGNKPPLSSIIKEALEEFQLYSDDYVFSLNTDKTLIREISLPFKERSRIEKILKFDIEQSIPFSPEEVIVDFDIKEIAPQNNKVIAYVVKKKDIKDSLELFESIGIQPKIITFSPYCLSLPSKDREASKGQAYAIVDIGNSFASLSIHSNQIPCFSRRFSSDFLALVGKVAKKNNSDLNEAEKSLFSSTNRDEYSELVADYAKNISKEILIAFAVYEAKHPNERIEKLFVTGKGAFIPEICERLKDATAISTEILEFPVSFEYVKTDDDPKKPIYSKALTTALAELGFNRRKINFRKEEYSYEWIDAKFKRRIRNVSIFLALIFLLYCVNSVFSLYQLRKVNDEIDKSIESIYRSMSPSGKIVDPVVQARQSVEELKDKAENFEELLGINISPLEVLDALSKNMEKGWTISLDKLSFQRRKVDINGEVKNVDEIDKFKNKLMGVDIFENVEIKKIEKNKRSELSNFKMEVKLKK